MSRYYQRPENALKKANEFIEVGKPTRALDTLYDVIKGKKHRAFSEKVIEPIMLKYLELCVELKKPHTAKEGLYQYRLMCQSVNVGLLEKVIRSFIRMAEERTELARDNLKNKVLLEQVTQAVVEVDDLDNVSMAEMTLLNVITEEQAQERSDRAALIPWVKFLWESYTQCLDLLRNNARLENLYHDIAQMAFKFCLSYNRKTEFRKLCERLRKHFDDIVNRASSQMNSIDFSSPETQQFNMETRLAQLDSAITMELWQEAYKAIEDIHLLMNQSKKSQTRMMAYYYQKLSLVFWKAGNLLFHAATMLKYYMLCKDMKKNVSQEELQKNASQVVIATLAISFPVTHPEFERFVETDKGMMEKAQKLATLLFLPQPPTRASLVRDLSRYNVLNNAISPLQRLHDLLETEFNPLGLCEQVDTILKEVISNEENEYLQQYVTPLQDVALVRLIKQVSQVYQSIDYNHLLEMTIFTSQSHLEQLLVDAVRYNDMQITIDHRSNCIRFGSSLAEASREDLPEGPHLQAMPSEAVRLQLVNVFNCFEETIDMINPSHLIHDEENLRTKIVNHYLNTEKQSHLQILQRQKIIADRREELERTAVDKENEEKWRNEQMLIQQQKMEAKRLETEREQRDQKRKELEKQEIQQRILKDKMDQITKTPFGIKVVSKMKEGELANLDMETVMQRQQEELAKEAKEHQMRMRAQEKRLDHLERAKRLEEIPVIEKYMKEKKEQEKKEWEAHEKERITHVIEERKLAVTNRERMKRMQKDKDVFLKGLLEGRRHVFVAKLDDFEKRLSDERVKRLQERKDQRREERRRKFIEEREEAERRRVEEERREIEAREREEREKHQREIDERNRVTEEKQRQRDREIEERERKQGGPESQPQGGPPQPEKTGAPTPWRRSGATGERERGLPEEKPRPRDIEDRKPPPADSVGAPDKSGAPGPWRRSGVRPEGGSGVRSEGGSGVRSEGGSGVRSEGGSGVRSEGGSGAPREIRDDKPPPRPRERDFDDREVRDRKPPSDLGPPEKGGSAPWRRTGGGGGGGGFREEREERWNEGGREGRDGGGRDRDRDRDERRPPPRDREFDDRERKPASDLGAQDKGTAWRRPGGGGGGGGGGFRGGEDRWNEGGREGGGREGGRDNRDGRDRDSRDTRDGPRRSDRESRNVGGGGGGGEGSWR